jgi:hypothetical protein
MYLLTLKLTLFLLPIKAAIHLWPDWSRVNGIKIDYYSPAIHFIDILIVILVLLSIKKIHKYLKAHKLLTTLYLGLVIINILISPVWQVTSYSWLRLSLHALFITSLIVHKITLTQIIRPIKASLFYIFPVAVIQIVQQGSVGGVLRFLGESQYNFYTPNIAKIEVFGHTIIRPYSLFAHPNIMSGYMISVMLLFGLSKDGLGKTVSIIIGTLSMSRAYLVSLVVYLVSQLSINLQKVLGTLLFCFILIGIYQLDNHPSYVYRKDQAIKAFQLIYQSPVWGTGLNSYVYQFSQNSPSSEHTRYLMQPIHNTPLLIMTEMGTLTLIIILTILVPRLRQKWIYLLPLGPLVMLDHYFYTTTSTRLILLIYLYILIKTPKKSIIAT